jgi:2-succinyl-6-hydroxy-2,4-cyclohexadiene-1-carboxylate synthase
VGLCLQALNPNHQSFIYALHGFLGESSDWMNVFKSVAADDHVACPSYFSDEIFSHLILDSFIQDIENHIELSFSHTKIFVGYSLGGRIGLRLLETRPDLFDHYVFVSTHSGLTSEADKEARMINDQKWIDRLHQSSWDEFLTAWNAQDVLKDSIAAKRPETSYMKDRLVAALLDYSLGKQKDYSALIAEHQDRITWVVGDQDTKFLNLAENLKQKKILLDYKRISSGHRILFDNPEGLAKIMESVLK